MPVPIAPALLPPLPLSTSHQCGASVLQLHLVAKQHHFTIPQAQHRSHSHAKLVNSPGHAEPQHCCSSSSVTEPRLCSESVPCSRNLCASRRMGCPTTRNLGAV